ncbi:hypothetical protein [uncultured Jatrophihabitans sp.]|uniref:hypothetical protein n=1 Tax=uncultured Jatrophihabitans sp. TaxID=1610747 RepID=UPI0035CB02CD
MSRSLDERAELRKLAHTLDSDESRLTMLAGVPAEDVRTLRAQAGEAMFQAGRPAFARVATLSKTLPTAVAAKLTVLTLPPLLAARVAELLEPARAADMVAKLPDAYLADVSSVLDPARAPEVVAAIPDDRVAAVSAELGRRREWVVISGFVSHVPPAALRASIAVFDGEQLVRIGFLIDDEAKLDAIAEMLADGQVEQMLTATVDHELWAELGDIVEHLSDERLTRMAGYYRATDALHAPFEAAAASGELEKAALARLAG